jgi:hypothetical protein
MPQSARRFGEVEPGKAAPPTCVSASELTFHSPSRRSSSWRTYPCPMRASALARSACAEPRTEPPSNRFDSRARKGVVRVNWVS